MQIRSITIGSQRKLPHPNIDFAAISGMVNITANLTPQDDFLECSAELQSMADVAVEKHLEAIAERMKMRIPAAIKPAAKTASMADALAEKHGGKF